MNELCTLTASEARIRLARGDITSEDLVGACLARIEAREPQVAVWEHLEPLYALSIEGAAHAV
jgi:Asp-tRNA(Asn)/Glu-tRNA(Gln) amidotransferase A subunit family amidase